MALRKLLIVSYHFPPSAASGSFRLLGFVRHLPKFGWETSVVAPPRLPWEPTDEGLLARVPPGTRIHHVRYPEGLFWKPVRKVAMLEMWLPFAWAAIRRVIRRENVDAVLTSGPPHAVHLLGMWLRRREDLLWAADFRDPWNTGDPTCLATSYRGWERRAEVSVMREADLIVANSPGALELLAGAHPEHRRKMRSITNGYDAEAFLEAPARAGAGPTLEIVHTGEIYANRDPRPLLEAIGSLAPGGRSGEKSIRLRFIGREGDTGRQFRELAAARGLGHLVEFVGQLPYSRAIEEMTRADVLLLLDTPGRRAGVPAKLFEYIGAGRPILALAEPGSDTATILRESGAMHRVAPPLDPTAIGRALADLIGELRLRADEPPAAGDRGRFTREALAADLARVLDSGLDGTARPPSDRLLVPMPAESIP
ncbi:MAG: glycosyltransferase family 4 protein [Isosphaeraceae bacterium]